MVEIIIQTEKKQIQIFTEDLGNGIELELVQIPSGTFIMGSPASEKDSRDSERPQHEVSINTFLMGRYPITQAQWRAVCETVPPASAEREDLKKERDLNPDPSKFKKPYQEIERWQRPVERVSWYDAVEFCHRLSTLTGRNYRLPSEAQWEYACRAVTSYQSSVTNEQLRINEWNEKYCQPFHFGETITSDLANYQGTSTYADEPEGVYREETTPVGMFPPNAFGLYDMHGNVWEWCEDDWYDNYNDAPTDGSAWVDKSNQSSNVVVRGGSWYYQLNNCRSAVRYDDFRRDGYFDYVGFRIVCVVGGDS